MDRKLPVRTKTVELDGDYAGWEMTVRLNVPFGDFVENLGKLQSAKTNKLSDILPPMYRLLELLISQWNFVDEKGNAIPVTKEGFAKLPMDLVTIAISKATEVVGQVPLVSGGS